VTASIHLPKLRPRWVIHDNQARNPLNGFSNLDTKVFWISRATRLFSQHQDSANMRKKDNQICLSQFSLLHGLSLKRKNSETVELCIAQFGPW
jgi:hypothetical protein